MTRVVIGTMQWGAAVLEQKAGRIFDCAVERGVRLFDTAPTYNNGEAERILGRCLKRCPDARVMTKGGYLQGWQPGELSESMSRLGVYQVEVYFLHRPLLQSQFALRSFCLTKVGGGESVRRLGLSNTPAWLAAELILEEPHAIEALQPLYNLLRRQAEVEILPFSRARRCDVYPYSPLAMGLLGGDASQVEASKRYQRRYEGALWRSPVAAGDALRWVMAHPAVTAPIVGPSSVQQLTELLDAAERPMEYRGEEYNALSALTPTPPPAHDRRDDEEER